MKIEVVRMLKNWRNAADCTDITTRVESRSWTVCDELVIVEFTV